MLKICYFFLIISVHAYPDSYFYVLIWAYLFCLYFKLKKFLNNYQNLRLYIK